MPQAAPLLMRALPALWLLSLPSLLPAAAAAMARQAQQEQGAAQAGSLAAQWDAVGRGSAAAAARLQGPTQAV